MGGVQDDGIARFFQDGELAFEETGGHEVISPGEQAGLDDLERSAQVDEAGLGQTLDEAIPVALPQRRAGQEDQFLAGRDGLKLGVENIEPRPAIGIGQGDASRHFCLVRGRMEIVGVKPQGAGFPGEHLRQGRFAAAGDAHHDEDRFHRATMAKISLGGPDNLLSGCPTGTGSERLPRGYRPTHGQYPSLPVAFGNPDYKVVRATMALPRSNGTSLCRKGEEEAGRRLDHRILRGRHGADGIPSW